VNQKFADKEAKRRQRRQRLERKIQNKRSDQQNNLKQSWLALASDLADEEIAIASYLYKCEQLARDLAGFVQTQNDFYFYTVEPHQDEDLSRLCQFNELKNLWLKRNQNNVLKVEKIPFIKGKDNYVWAYNEFYQETFFSYFDNVQLYRYEVKIGAEKYLFIADRCWGNCSKSAENIIYAKRLSSEKRQTIKQSLGKLLPVVEYGCQSFWRKYWSKEKNALIQSQK